MYTSIKGYNRINVSSAQRIERRKEKEFKQAEKVVGKRTKTVRRVALRDLFVEEA